MSVCDMKPRKLQRSVQMADLERGIEWLRPLVDNQPWDYCVIWKLGDDPSRFIEWGACCCSGGRRGGGIRIKGEKQLECRDSFIKHLVTSNACRKLAHLPSVIPLYSGIHGDVVISKRPRWSNADEPNGTQVLIPVTWGLIEIFTTMHVPRDQKIIDYISDCFRVPLKQESMMENNYQENCPPSFQYPNLASQIPQPTNYSSFEGSSTCSSLSNEHQLLQLGHDHVLSGVSLEKSSKDYVDSQGRNPRLRRKRYADSACTNGNDKVGMKTRQKIEKGPFKSKNLETERNRRKRIKDRELVLRSLVPNITKMDKLATLKDAADYIKELVETVRKYEDELKALEEEERNEAKAAAECSVLVRECNEKKGGESENTAIVVGVEVIQIGTKDFLVKSTSKQKRGAFSHLMEAIDCLGLEVADANVTTLHGLVSNVLRVELKAKREDIDATALKHSLAQLIN